MKILNFLLQVELFSPLNLVGPQQQKFLSIQYNIEIFFTKVLIKCWKKIVLNCYFIAYNNSVQTVRGHVFTINIIPI